MSDPFNSHVNKCIYCDTSQKLCRSSHIIPRCLGTFRNQPTLRYRVCRDCEEAIGQCEDILAKCAPEALFKANLGIKGRHEKSTSPFRRKHMGYGPIKMKIKYPGTDYEMLVEPVGDGKNCQIIPHIEICDAHGNNKQIIIEDPDSLTADKLKKLIFSTEIKHPTKVWPRMQKNEQVDRIFDLLKACGLYVSEEMAEDIKPFEGTVKAGGQIVGDGRRFRAIVKIAFHYYLNFNSFKHTGDEDVFMPVRDFIRYGKGRLKDFIIEKKGYFVEQLKWGWKPPTYGHIIVATVNDGFINVKIQLFVGPNYEPPYYEVFIGENPFKIEIPGIIFGHNYAYDDNQESKNYDGSFHQLLATKLILNGF